MSSTRPIVGLTVGTLLLLGTGFAKADYEWADQLVSTWNNVSTGENMVIQRGELGFLEIRSSNGGEGRIVAGSNKGSNIVVEGKAAKCAYYLTVISSNQINMQLRDGPDSCVKGVFLRVAETPAPQPLHVDKSGLVLIVYHHDWWRLCGC